MPAWDLTDESSKSASDQQTSPLDVSWSYGDPEISILQVKNEHIQSHLTSAVPSDRCSTMVLQQQLTFKKRVRREDAALPDSKRRKLGDKRETDNKGVDGYSKSPPVPRHETLVPSTVLQDKQGNTFSRRLFRKQIPAGFLNDATLPNVVVTGLDNKCILVTSQDDTSLSNISEQHIKSNAFKREFRSEKCICDHSKESHPDIQRLPTKHVTLDNCDVNINTRLAEDNVINIALGAAAPCETADDVVTCSCSGNKFGDTFNAIYKSTRSRSSTDNTSISNMYRQLSKTLKRHKLSPGVRSLQRNNKISGRELRGQRMLEASQSFQLIMDRQLRILYVSENVSLHLGYLQTDMLDHSIEDYIHPDNMSDVMRVLTYNMKSDHKSRTSLNRTRRFYAAMKVCQRSSGSKKDTGFTLVQWNFQLNLKKSGQGVRVQGLIGICRPVRNESLFAIHRDGNMLKSHHDVSFLFIFCNTSHKETVHKLSKRKKSFNEKKYLDFSKETDLPVLKLVKSNQSLTSSYQKIKKIDIDMLLEHILCSDLVKYQVTPCSSFKMQGNLTTVSKCNNDGFNSVKSLCNMTPPHKCQSKSLEASMKSVSHYNINIRKEMPLNLNKTSLSILNDRDTNFIQANDADRSMENIYKGKFNLADMDTTQEYLSHLMSDTSVSSVCFNPLSLFPDSLNPFVLMDTFQALPQAHIDDLEFCELYMPNNTKLPRHYDEDCKSTGSAIANDKEAVSEKLDKGAQSRKYFDNFDIFDCVNKVPDTGILHHNCLTPNLCTLHLSQGNICSLSKGDYHNTTTVNCQLNEHTITEAPNYMVTNRLASLLQMESVPKSIKTQNMKTDFLMSVSKSTKHEKKLRNSDVVHSDIQNTEIHSTNTCSSNCESHISPVNEHHLSDCLKSFLQVSSPFSLMSSSSCTSSPLTSHLLSSSPDINVLYNNTSNENQDQRQMEVDDIYNNELRQFRKLLKRNNSSEREKSSLHNLMVAEPDYVNDVTSVMTNTKSDPFLNQLSFTPEALKDFDSSTCSAKPYLIFSQTSPLATSEMLNKHSNINPEEICHPHSSNSHNLENSSSTMEDVPAISDSLTELNTFLSNIQNNTCLTTDLNKPVSIPLKDHLGSGPHIPLLELKLESSAADTTELRSNDFSDTETSVRHSLLRTLLDKEGVVIQGPLTYTEWLLKQALKKKRNMKKAKMSFGIAKSRFAGSRKTKGSKNEIKKSVELPLPKSSHGCKMSFGCRLQHKKMTKELPLPSSALTATFQSVSPQLDIASNKSILQQDIFDKNRINSDNMCSQNADDFNLPDDLLDMAVEYCASLGTDQAEALILDLNDNFLFEDSLYSLIGSPTQDSDSLSSRSSNGTQLQSEITISDSSLVWTTESFSNKSKSEESSDNTFTEGSHLSSTHSSSTPAPLQPRLQMTLAPLCLPEATNKERAMSLLRAAVTSPNVDKLIEQIPLDNSNRYKISEHEHELKSGDYPDILVTKITKPQTYPNQSLTSMPVNKASRVPSTNTVELLEEFPLSISSCRPLSLIKASDQIDEKDFYQFDKKTLSKIPDSNGEQLPNLLRSNNSYNVTIPRSDSNPFILKISVHSGSPAKVNRGSQKNINQNVKLLSSQATPRLERNSAQCLSSTQPVSVMIMRKENHRSRRSKNIAVQTDNQPGEVYPEFERSPSDKFIYPSVVICSDPPPVSPQSNMSSAPISQSSPASMSELEKYVYSHSDNSSSSSEEFFQTRSSTPFLQRLLMGELSKEQYQRLDQQMLDEERKVSILSRTKRTHSSQSV